MKKLFSTMLIALLCGAGLIAQERVQKVITIKNGNLAGIVHTVRELAPSSNVAISTDNEHIILSGAKDAVTGFEEMIKQLDVPQPAKNNVETTVYMIIATSHAANPAPIPAELDPVIAQLKNLFAYKGFRLLDSFVLRSRSGERGENTGFVPPNSAAPDGAKITYHFQFARVHVDGSDPSRLVRFDGLELGLHVPTGANAKGETTYSSAGIRTDVDVPEGKKIVVGKTSAVEGSDSALILVISAKVVD